MDLNDGYGSYQKINPFLETLKFFIGSLLIIRWVEYSGSQYRDLAVKPDPENVMMEDIDTGTSSRRFRKGSPGFDDRAKGDWIRSEMTKTRDGKSRKYVEKPV